VAKGPGWTAAGILLLIVLIALSSGVTVHVASAPAPEPSSAAVVAPSALPSAAQPAVIVATPQPTPTPVSDPFSAPRWASANTALISMLLFMACLPWLVLVGIGVHSHYRGRLLELDHPPLRDRESVHAAYRWKMA
jgi:hypothetical protein